MFVEPELGKGVFARGPVPVSNSEELAIPLGGSNRPGVYLCGERVFRIRSWPSPQERNMKGFEIHEHHLPFVFPELINLVGADVVSHSDQNTPHTVVLTLGVAPTIIRKQPSTVPLFGEFSLDIGTLLRVEPNLPYAETVQTSRDTLVHNRVSMRQAIGIAERERELGQ